MNGKDKCKALKEIRKEIAKNNNIEYIVEECKHKGECKGTCPKCEAEVRYLEKELAKRRTLGQRVAVAGVAAGLAASFSACSPGTIISDAFDNVTNIFSGGSQDLDGAPQVMGDMSEPDYVLDGEVSPDDYSEYEDDIEDENEPEGCDIEDNEGSEGESDPDEENDDTSDEEISDSEEE